jgi:hypothetical protein
VWVGDFNVSHTDADVSDARYFGAQMPAMDPANSGAPALCVPPSSAQWAPSSTVACAPSPHLVLLRAL